MLETNAGFFLVCGRESSKTGKSTGWLGRPPTSKAEICTGSLFTRHFLYGLCTSPAGRTQEVEDETKFRFVPHRYKAQPVIVV
jgi:hypothetical protein